MSDHPTPQQPVPAIPYNSAGLQRERIKGFLIGKGVAGALAVEIGRECCVPCVTKRISELVAAGVLITKQPDRVSGPHGLNDATRYFLLEPDGRQGSLDLRPQDLTP
jgi:hypothetical protein